MEAKRCPGCMKLKKQSPVCEHCGFDEAQANASHQLPLGTVLKEQYLIGKVLGQGGFGITYIGWDQNLEIPLAIKEYYPNGLVARDCSHSLEVSSSGYASETFQHNRERFLREARALAKLYHVPGIVKIYNYFPENNTAYIVMEYVRGVDLKGYIKRQGRPLTPAETFAVLRPVMDALSTVHEAGLVHRDISPDNIMIQYDGSAKLLDFGAVREVKDADVAKNLSRSTESILKHGYAPIEQYQRRGNLGPWTDIYALCATVYYCLTQTVPPDAPERMIEEAPLEWEKIEGLTAKQVEIFTHGMALLPKDRIVSIAELRRELFPPEPQPPVVPEPPVESPKHSESVWEQRGANPTVMMLTPQRPEDLPPVQPPKPSRRQELLKQMRQQQEQRRMEQERQEQRRQEQARLEQQRQEQWKQEQLRQEQEKQEKLRLAREQKERERQEQERLEAQRQEQLRVERERREAEKREQQRLAREQKERERQEQARLEAQRQEQLRLERERREAEKREQLRLAREQKERERQEQERLERERQEKLRLEQERREAAKREKRRLEQERREAEQRRRREEQQRQEEEKQQRREAQLERRRARQAQQESQPQPRQVQRKQRRKPNAILVALALLALLGTAIFQLKPEEEAILQELVGETVAETTEAVEETMEATLPELMPLTAEDFLPEVNAPACTLVSSHYNQHGSDAFTYHARNNGNVLFIESDGLYITVTDGNEVSITVSGLEIKDTYATNQKDSYYSVLEYGWHVYLFGEMSYSVGTSSWAFDPGNTTEKTIGQMQKTLWQVDGIKSDYTETLVGVQWTPDSITWTYTIPEEYPFDFTKLKQVALHVDNDPEELHTCRVYNPDTGADKSTVAAEETRFAYMPAENPTYAPDAWKNNVMASFTQGHNAFVKTSIRSVIFLDTVQDAPDVHWDVSEGNNGSVLMWLDRSMAGTDMYIAAEGGVNAGEICLGLFEGYTKLEKVHFNGHFHTDNVCRMDSMFQDCGSLTEVDLSSLNTDSLSIMSYMFAGCTALQSLDFANWNTSNVEYMEAVFWGCSKLEELDLSSFDTSNVIYMDWMFRDCSNLTELDLGNFDTAKVKQMNKMFQNCSQLISLDLHNFSCSSLTSCENMFSGCVSLAEPDISNWDVSNVNVYKYFMDEGKTINGRPWQEFFK